MHSFIGNTVKLLTGNMIAQGLVLVVTPLLTRIFAPEAFGLAALFASVASILGVVACLRYELAIMLPNDDVEAANLLCASICFVMMFSAVTAFVIYLADDVIVNILNAPQLKSYIRLIPLAVLATGISLPFRYWLSRNRKFGRISISQIFSSGASQTSKLIAGYSGHVTGGIIIWGNLIGLITFSVLLGAHIWQEDRHFIKASVRWKKMIASIQRHKKFPLYSTWSALLNAASTHLPRCYACRLFLASHRGLFRPGHNCINPPHEFAGQICG